MPNRTMTVIPATTVPEDKPRPTRLVWSVQRVTTAPGDHMTQSCVRTERTRPTRNSLLVTSVRADTIAIQLNVSLHLIVLFRIFFLSEPSFNFVYFFLKGTMHFNTPIMLGFRIGRGAVRSCKLCLCPSRGGGGW